MQFPIDWLAEKATQIHVKVVDPEIERNAWLIDAIKVEASATRKPHH